ncbi:hypothetical protein ACFQZ4_02625 [Catellatospora coxensis]
MTSLIGALPNRAAVAASSTADSASPARNQSATSSPYVKTIANRAPASWSRPAERPRLNSVKSRTGTARVDGVTAVVAGTPSPLSAGRLVHIISSSRYPGSAWCTASRAPRPLRGP